MRSFAVLMLVAASAVACAAAQTAKQEQEVGRLLSMMQSPDYDSNGQHPRNLDAVGGPSLVRDARGARDMAYFPKVGIDSISGIGFGAYKRTEGMIHKPHHMQFPAVVYDIQKPNPNPNEVGKRNFDEIDRSGFDGFVKRNFDEIDRNSFDVFDKRSPSAGYVAIPHYAYRYYENEH